MALSNAHRRAGRVTAVMALAALTLAGCGHSKPKVDPQAGLFNSQSQAKISCLAHQTEQPSKLYTGGDNADTAHILELFQYYTANGDKKFCDSAPATATDLVWARLYVSLGGDATKVKAVLGTP